jgi:hypothetical protein
MAFTQVGSELPAARNEAGAAGRSPAWRRPTALFVALLALGWLLLYALYAALPMVQSGAMIIYGAKFDHLVKRQMFAPGDRTRIMMFGNSKVVTGFHPGEFDAALGPGVRSYNLGLPGEPLFLPMLEAALAAGNVPTHVLLTIPWDERTEPPAPLAVLHDDNALINRLLPFRTFPRDFVLFAYNNRFRFGDGIRHATGERDMMVENRGWYFIKWQSHYLNDRLPDDFTVPTDHPGQLDARKVPAASLVRDRLLQLATKYNFLVLLVPSYRRVGEFAPAPSAEAERDTAVSAAPPVRVLGPDYWTYPASQFADPVHLNPSGKSVYTAELAALLRKHLAL